MEVIGIIPVFFSALNACNAVNERFKNYLFFQVTVVSLRASGQFWEQLQNGNVKNAHAIVRYSPEYNILTKQGRIQLMNIFLGMKMLLQNLEM